MSELSFEMKKNGSEWNVDLNDAATEHGIRVHTVTDHGDSVILHFLAHPEYSYKFEGDETELIQHTSQAAEGLASNLIMHTLIVAADYLKESTTLIFEGQNNKHGIPIKPFGNVTS